VMTIDEVGKCMYTKSKHLSPVCRSPYMAAHSQCAPLPMTWLRRR
jgi:hypothetical protein